MDKEEFLSKAISKFGNKYDYSKVIFIDKDSFVTIICKEHGEFQQKPSVHLLCKIGCPICGDKSSRDNHRTTIEEFIEQANKIHNNKYDYSMVKFNVLNDNISIICPTHGIFKQKAIYHLSNGCVKCYRDSQKLTKEIVLSRLNNLYDFEYSNFDNYINNKQIIEYTCPRHGGLLS